MPHLERCLQRDVRIIIKKVLEEWVGLTFRYLGRAHLHKRTADGSTKRMQDYKEHMNKV